MDQINTPKTKLISEISIALQNGILKKITFSKPRNKAIIKVTAEPVMTSRGKEMKITDFLRDGKALQKQMPISAAPELLAERAFAEFGEINLVGNGKTLTLMISEKGKTHFVGSLEGAAKTELLGENKEKNYILIPERGGDFLKTLGITDGSGKIKDKKQAKYRQINKFLEQVKTVSDKLPREGKLTVCDLCCGKSYLTFAVYWYFTEILRRDVEMYGVDLKPDVIQFCTELKNRLGWNMNFICGDVSKFSPPSPPDLVISLHACDVATDYVLAGAIRSGAKVILSTPCCQHEFNSQMKCDELSFITEHSILKQKLAVAATDALRAQFLEIHGYSVTVCELIDPEETPKNVLIRAVKRSNRERSGKSIPELEKKYKAACEFLGVKPTLARIFDDES